jgi:hypothetical protein
VVPGELTFQSLIQAQQSRRKENQNQAKKKGLDFLGFACPKRAFSKGCADPQAKFLSCSFVRRWLLR